MLYTGQANFIEMQGQDDGSWIVTVSRGDSDTETRMHVFDLYGKDEEVLNEIDAPKTDPTITGRIKQAHDESAAVTKSQPSDSLPAT